MIALVAVAIRGPRGLTFVLLQVLAAVPVAYILGLAYGRLRLAKVLGEHVRPTGDVRADVARLEDGAEEVVRRLADRLERSSLVLPLVGFVLLLPLVLHFLTAQLVGRLVSSDMASVTGFDRWISLGFMTLGQCFLVAAWKSWSYAVRLRATATNALPLLDDMANGAPWDTIASLVAASVVAGFIYVVTQKVALFIVAPLVSSAAVLIVGVTGVVVIPALYTWAHRQLLAERRVLGT
jgi:hypothetical protein